MVLFVNSAEAAEARVLLDDMSLSPDEYKWLNPELMLLASCGELDKGKPGSHWEIGVPLADRLIVEGTRLDNRAALRFLANTPRPGSEAFRAAFGSGDLGLEGSKRNFNSSIWRVSFSMVLAWFCVYCRTLCSIGVGMALYQERCARCHIWKYRGAVFGIST
jgi:hypothetical protein